MLYLSTINKADTFTAHKVLRSTAAPDGGKFMPMQLPVLDDFALAQFEEMSFGEAVAAIVNLFFGTGLTGWDVDLTIGRQAVELVSIGHKVSVAESWHNPVGLHSYFEQRLYNLVIGDKRNTQAPNPWFCTVVNIAVLFAIYGKYSRQEIYEFDVAVDTADLQMLLAVRYAKKMGLPVRSIILGCTDEDGMWELLTHGDYPTLNKERSIGLEALLWLEFQYAQTEKYCTCIEKKTTYRLSALHLDKFRSDVYVTVVGDNRVKNIMENTMKTDRYRMEERSARAFGALLNHRSKTGEKKNTLLFAQNMSKA